MYRIPTPTADALDTHYNRYSPAVLQLMERLMAGHQIPVTLGRSKPVTVNIQVRNDSYTYEFICKYHEEVNLRQLLCGDWQTLLSIVNEVNDNIPNLYWQQDMAKSAYEAHNYTVHGTDGDGHDQIDHFNTILYWLFVEQMYEGGNGTSPFQKVQFVKDRKMTVCPYCGRVPIHVGEEPGRRTSAPPIDHFLPKSKYPFLAMSFYNLIPCCSKCKDIQNKSNFDPILLDPYIERLINPYVFRKDAVSFCYHLDDTEKLDEKRYLISSEAANEHLDEGYLSVLKLRSLYSQEHQEVKKLHVKYTTLTDSCKKYLHALGPESEFLANLPFLVLGYLPDENEAPRQLYYKFKEDIYNQLCKDYPL